jgi:ATP-binding cassette subfamily B protein
MVRKPRSIHDQKSTNWKQSFTALRYIPRFFKKVYEASPKLFVYNLFARLVISVSPIAMLWVGKLIVDEVVNLVNKDISDSTQLWWYVGIELGLAIFTDLLNRSIQLTDGLIGDLYANKSSVEIIQKTGEVELEQLEDPEFYDKLERARRQTTSRVTLMSNVLSQFQDLITIVSLITGLIVFEPWLIVLLVFSIIPAFLNEIKYSRSTYSLARGWTTERRELDYLRYTGASDKTAKEIKLFNLSDFIADRFDKLSHRYYLETKKLNIKKNIWGGIFNILGVLAYYGAYILIIARTIAGVISIGELTFLSGSFRGLRMRMQGMFTRFSRISESALYLKDYFDFLDIEKVGVAANMLRPIPTEIKEGFEFVNVHFSYPQADTEVLKGINFKMKVGEKMAFVGENGAGKTTLIKLILRFYEPTKGKILLDGIDIRNFDKVAYQKLFGVIFQDFVKYDFTAGENIAVGNIEQKHNIDRIEKAAELSLAEEVIDILPKGYDQRLGKRFKEGQELSGGQWQKIALARAYMKDSEVVILDEPTSALDARAEYEAFQRFIGLTKGKTSIIISHRFSTVRMADRILVLKDGQVLELGTHEELLASGDLYAELFNLQAEGYN